MGEETTDNPIVKLTPPSQFLAPCPKFRVLVLGNPESTKQELFSRVFGVDLEKKLVADAFSPTHDINVPLDLKGQNNRLEIFTSPNFFFSPSSESGGDYLLAYATLRIVSQFIHDTNSQSQTSLSSAVDESVAAAAAAPGPDTRNLHCIWYCVSAADPSRPISPVEQYFFHHLSQIVPQHVPVLLLFTKYDEFVSQVQMDWTKSVQEKGMSKVAVAHILRDLVTKRFEDTIGKKWGEVLSEVDSGLLLENREREKRRDSGFGYGGSDRKDVLEEEDEEEGSGRRRKREVVRVLVGGGGESFEQDWGGEPAWPGEELAGVEEGGGYGELVKRTLEGLREGKEVRRAFAAAQRCLAGVSSEFAAELASTYFDVDTGHARKLHGVDVRDIMPNFYAKAVQLFNLRDVSSVLDDPQLLIRILQATFGMHQRILVDESLSHSSTEPCNIFLGLSPHERAVMLAQAMAAVILFLHKLADVQWPHRDNSRGILPPATITARDVQRVIDEIETGTEKRELLEEIESSPIFTSCRMRKEVADLIHGAVEKADKTAASHFTRKERRGVLMVDDSDLQEISLAFVNDKGPDDMVLPNGLRILPLNG